MNPKYNPFITETCFAVDSQIAHLRLQIQERDAIISRQNEELAQLRAAVLAMGSGGVVLNHRHVSGDITVS